MSRVRTSLSATPLDREVSSRVDSATQLVVSALQVVESKLRDKAYSKPHVVRVQRDLQRCLGALNSVRRVSLNAEEAKPVAPPLEESVSDLEEGDLGYLGLEDSGNEW